MGIVGRVTVIVVDSIIHGVSREQAVQALASGITIPAAKVAAV